jgi:hypothetical protein
LKLWARPSHRRLDGSDRLAKVAQNFGFDLDLRGFQISKLTVNGLPRRIRATARSM